MRALLKYWHGHFLGIEAVVAIVPGVALATWLVGYGGDLHVDQFMDSNRANIYRTTAGISGTLLGFSIAAVSLVLNSASSPRLSLVRNSRHYPVLWKTFLQTTKSLGALTVISLVCLTWDRESSPQTWLVVPFCFLLTLSILRLFRVVWILEQIITIVTAPVTRQDDADFPDC